MEDRAKGVIEYTNNNNRKTDYLFRVSIKCLIRNEQGDVLVVKESGRAYWDLPGGGMDHGEVIKQAIARELYEEVSITSDFDYQIIAVEDPKHLLTTNLWQTRLIFAVSPVFMEFAPGEDGDDVAFIDPLTLKNSSNVAERFIYDYSTRLTL